MARRGDGAAVANADVHVTWSSLRNGPSTRARTYPASASIVIRASSPDSSVSEKQIASPGANRPACGVTSESRGSSSSGESHGAAFDDNADARANANTTAEIRTGEATTLMRLQLGLGSGGNSHMQ